MKKREIVWIIIKLIGLYCVYAAITQTISFIGSFILVFQELKLFGKSFSVFLQAILLIGFYGVVENYLLKDGTLLFDLLNREEPPNSLKENLEKLSIK